MYKRQVVVSTKFLPRTNEEIANGISGQEHIRRMVDKSLQNLGMDYIDLYIYHMWDYQTPLYDILEGLNQVVKAGKVRYLGISNCFAWQLCKANDLARAEGFPPFVSLQGHSNLLFREEERDMFPFCREENIALTPYSALAGGRLSKHPGETSQRLEQDSYAKGKYDGAADQDAPILAQVAALAQARGVSMTEISLAWLLTKVTSPVAVSYTHLGTTTILFQGGAPMLHIAICDDDPAAVQTHREITEQSLRQCQCAGEISIYTHSNNLLYDLSLIHI